MWDLRPHGAEQWGQVSKEKKKARGTLTTLAKHALREDDQYACFYLEEVCVEGGHTLGVQETCDYASDDRYSQREEGGLERG